MDLVIFDVDGTLVDSQTMIVGGMTETFARHGRPAPAQAAVLGIVGLSLAEAMRRLAPDADDTEIAAIVATYKASFHTLRANPAYHEPLFPGARTCLDGLAARDDVLLGIATGKSRRGVAAILDLHDLHGRFATIQTADDHPSKPHPSMVLTAIAETGVAPDRTVMIGDASFDMTMARAAGVFAIGVGWGYQSTSSLEATGAHALVADYDAVIPTIARLLNW